MDAQLLQNREPHFFIGRTSYKYQLIRLKEDTMEKDKCMCGARRENMVEDGQMHEKKSRQRISQSDKDNTRM